MTTPPAFDGTQRLFQIGLKPLDFNEWIDVDTHIARYLDEKARLEARHPADIFAAEHATDAAQAEILDLLVTHLPRRFPEIYHRDGSTMSVTGRTVALDAAEPLRIAARLVQEDLILMRRGAAGWRLAAGSLSFPSSWRLREKFGHPIHEIHAPVPGFGDGSRNAELIARMFDNLKPAIGVIRWNWSIYPEPDLYHPASGEGGLRFAAGLENAFLRVERQTLRKLPVSGDILFTIRIYVDPLPQIARQPNGAAIAAGLAEQLRTLDADQLAYKGLSAARDELVARLGTIGMR
jgi:hypothetical protein